MMGRAGRITSDGEGGSGRCCAQEGDYKYRSSRSSVSLDILPTIGLGVSHTLAFVGFVEDGVHHMDSGKAL